MVTGIPGMSDASLDTYTEKPKSCTLTAYYITELKKKKRQQEKKNVIKQQRDSTKTKTIIFQSWGNSEEVFPGRALRVRSGMRSGLHPCIRCSSLCKHQLFLQSEKPDTTFPSQSISHPSIYLGACDWHPVNEIQVQVCTISWGLLGGTQREAFSPLLHLLVLFWSEAAVWWLSWSRASGRDANCKDGRCSKG